MILHTRVNIKGSHLNFATTLLFFFHQTEPWRLSIHCAHYQMVYTATSEDELLRLSLAMSSSCEVNRWPPDLENLTLCRRDWFENLIYQCNVTGKWEKHDPDVEDRCARKNQISNRIRAVINNEEVLFSNLYCMYCNLRKDEVYDLSLCDMDIRAPHNYFNYLDRPPPFSLLLGLKDSEPEKIYEYVSPTLGPDNCNDTEWATPDGDCLPLNCTPGKIASDFNCTTALDRIRGLGYTISLYLTAQMISDTAHNTTSHSFETRKSNRMVFRRAVKKIFKDLPLDDYSISLSPIFDVDNVSAPTDAAITEKKGCSGQECYISACMIASKLYGRDYIEDLMVNGLVGNFTMTGSKTHLLNVTYHMIPLVNAHKTECKSNLYDKLILKPPKKEDLDLKTLIRQNYRETYSKFPDSFQIWNYIDAFIALSNTLNCLFVSFPSDKFKLQREKDSSAKSWSLNIEFDSAEIIVSDPLDLSGALVGEDGQLKVCRYVLQKNIRLRKQLITSYAFSTNSDMSFWQSTVTLICLGASTACLAITVVTYCLFAELRSIAGWHNLLLAATLLVAQGLLLASAYTDGPSTWCTVLGVATHYSWLSMFCWSFACCFHMFRVFTAKTRMAGRDSASARRLFLMKRVVFTAGIPAVVVTSLMVGVNTSTGGQDIGYGKRSCYLDSAFLVGVATVLPLAVATLCNVVFFTVAVYKIYSVRKLQSNDMAKKENTKNLFVYIRLSTLTGVCWTIAIIAEAADNDPLRFIYIIFNGLQGVFIFLSYICNRRVLLLYTGKDSEKKNTSSALSESGTNRQHRSEVTTSTFSSTISGPD